MDGLGVGKTIVGHGGWMNIIYGWIDRRSGWSSRGLMYLTSAG